MELLINNYPVDFKIENENSLPDIISFIGEWSKERGLIFLEVIINGKSYEVEGIENEVIENFEKINCLIESKAAIVFSSLDEGVIYCNRVIDFINKSLEGKEADENNVKDLSKGIEWLIEVLHKVANIIGLDVNQVKYRDRVVADFLIELNELSSDIVKEINNENFIDYLAGKKSFFEDLKEIFRILLLSDEMKEVILKSIDSPDVLMSSLHEIRESLPAELKNIENIAIDFQTGKDSDGSSKLNQFVDFLMKYTRVCYQVSPVFGIDLSKVIIDDMSMEDLNNSIMKFLNEISDAMESNDIVSFADILEYEIMPLLENLNRYVDTLINETRVK